MMKVPHDIFVVFGLEDDYGHETAFGERVSELDKAGDKDAASFLMQAVESVVRHAEAKEAGRGLFEFGTALADRLGVAFEGFDPSEYLAIHLHGER